MPIACALACSAYEQVRLIAVRLNGLIRRRRPLLAYVVVIVVAGCLSASASLAAAHTPRLLLFGALAGSPDHIVYRPSHFAVNPTPSATRVGKLRPHSAATASVLEEFPAAVPQADQNN